MKIGLNMESILEGLSNIFGIQLTQLRLGFAKAKGSLLSSRSNNGNGSLLAMFISYKVNGQNN